MAHKLAMTFHLPILSDSLIKTFNRCRREYRESYVNMRKPRSSSRALTIGTDTHLALNNWHSCQDLREGRRQFVLDHVESSDPFDRAMIRAMMAGYHERWASEPLTTIEVELEFEVSIKTYHGDSIFVRGAIDAIVRDSQGRHWIVEHKTTSRDIGQGSPYWTHVVSLDPQVSTYLYAAEQLGVNAHGVIYDVLRKPSLTRELRTPDDKLKYTIPTKKNPVPRLYSGMRETDETANEYERRLMLDIASRPEHYYRREVIVRTGKELVSHLRDVAETAREIEFSTVHDAFPRSPGSCHRYGSLCGYHGVCSGYDSLANDVRFETRERGKAVKDDGEE